MSDDLDAVVRAARAANLARWEELVPVHLRSRFYDVDGFRAGRPALCAIEREELGDVRGKRVLHLMCHFGMGTLTLARAGAIATGVDVARAAIEVAERLSEEIGVRVDLICCDVHDLPERLHGTFDIVFCNYGALIWLHDLSLWARGVSACLRPGGFFYIVDEHPFALVCAGAGRTSDLRLTHSYFSSAPVEHRVRGSYADRDAPVHNDRCYLWIHSLSKLVNALIEAGLRVDFLHEHPYCVYEMFAGMTADAEGKWRFEGAASLPYLFSLKASRPPETPVAG